jgi:hypothetical protein
LRLRLHLLFCYVGDSVTRTWSNCSINPFFFFTVSRLGSRLVEHAQWCRCYWQAPSSSTIIPPSAVAAAPSTSYSTSILYPSRQRLVLNRARRPSLPHPLHRTGAQAFQYERRTPSVFTICAWPVVSAPGATCPPLPEIVCAACSAGGSEKNGIFWWFSR